MDSSSLNRQEKIQLYQQGPELLEAALQRFPKEMWHFRAHPEDWTIHEIVVHITDSEANSYVRCRRFIAEPGLPLMAYDENQWARALNYHERDVDTAVSLFRWLRRSSYQLLQGLPEAAWAHEAYHPENGQMSFLDWLDTYSHHVPDHIEQMTRVFEKWQSLQAQ